MIIQVKHLQQALSVLAEDEDEALYQAIETLADVIDNRIANGLLSPDRPLIKTPRYSQR